MTTFEKNRWAETCFKRLWWQGYKGAVYSFNWPTLANNNFWDVATGEHHFDNSEFRAWLSAPALASVFNALNGNGKLRVLAHSMGNVVTGEAINQYTGPSIHTYIAAQAAMSAHYYDNSIQPVLSSPDTPNIIGYFPSVSIFDDSYLVGNQAKVVHLYDYFNAVDWALARWETNNNLKPTGFLYLFGYKGSITSYTPGDDHFFRGEINNFYETYEPTGDLYNRATIFSYIAESRSKTLGQLNSTPFIPIDLHNQMGYGADHYSHSKEFRSNLPQQNDFWVSVFNDCYFTTTKK